MANRFRLENLTGGGLNSALGLALALAVVAGAAGCAALDPSGSTVSRDVLEIKHQLEKHQDETDSSNRKIEYRLDTIDEKIETRTEMLKAAIEDMDRVIRNQASEIEKLRRMLEDMNYQMSGGAPPSGAMNGGLNSAGGEGTAMGGGDPAPADAETAYMDALKQYNLGRYDLARKGFEQVLAGGAQGDQAIQAQYWLSEACFALDDLVAAHDNYTKLIVSNQSHALAWKSLERLGEIAEKQGRNADALRLYDQIINRNPGYPNLERVSEKAALLRGDAPEAPAVEPPTN